MKYIIFFIITVFLNNQNIIAQDSLKEFYNIDFKWKLSIPSGFINVAQEEISHFKKTGDSAIGEVNGKKFENESTLIFALKNGDYNLFDASYESYDSLIDGVYLSSCKNLYNTTYKIFTTQAPNVFSVDTTISTELIDNLLFQKMYMRIFYTNNKFWHTLTYNRLFGNKSLTVNISFADFDKGELMIESWEKSKFGNTK